MKLSNSFRIDRPPSEVFDAFLDIERIAECMPGSKLLGQPEKDIYDGEVRVKVGPLGVAYSGQFQLLSAKKDELRLTMHASGREKRGAGGAEADVVAQLSEHNGGTLVEITTVLNIHGKVAQFGRGAIGEVTDGIIVQFAKNVEAMLVGAHTPDSAAFGSGRAAHVEAEVRRAHTEPNGPSSQKIDAWAFIVRPILRRHSRAIASIGIAMVMVYVGARAFARKTARHTPTRPTD